MQNLLSYNLFKYENSCNNFYSLFDNLSHCQNHRKRSSDSSEFYRDSSIDSSMNFNFLHINNGHKKTKKW